MTDSYPTISLLGGRLCLDFCNTAGFRGSDRHFDVLTSYDYLLHWAHRVGTLSTEERQSLFHQTSPRDAETALRVARELRATLYDIFTAVIDAKEAPPAVVAHLNTLLSSVLAKRRLQPLDSGFYWEWEGSDSTRPLWEVLLSAAEVLTSEDVGRLRQCPNCGWLFVDTSRNHTRRWCSMDACGSEIKSRRQYERKRKTTQEASGF